MLCMTAGVLDFAQENRMGSLFSRIGSSQSIASIQPNSSGS